MVTRFSQFSQVGKVFDVAEEGKSRLQLLVVPFEKAKLVDNNANVSLVLRWSRFVRI